MNFPSDVNNGVRIPPQAVDVERSVLGAMLIDKDALPKALEVLDGTSFYNPTHQKYFNAMIALFEKGDPVNAITVIEELRRRGQYGTEDAMYIAELTTTISTGANVEYHSRIILEKALKRGLISNSTEIASRAYNDTEDALDLLDDAEALIFKISEQRLKKNASPVKKVLSDTFEMLQGIHGKHGGVTGVTSGFRAIDDMTGGFQDSDLIIVAGRPSQGKTAFALAVARNAMMDREKPTGIAFFSIEMSEKQLGVRLLAAEARLNAHDLRTGRLADEDWIGLSRSVGPLAQSKMFIDDTPALGILELRAKARRMKSEYDIGLVIVDYLQLIQGPKSAESREREVSSISRSLKALAKELDVPVIALSQLNRSVEGRSDKRPILADLRESGAIEQDADVVMFVHRPETYGIPEVKDDEGTTMATEGLAEIIIAKQRNGPAGIVRLAFRKHYAGFEALAPKSVDVLVPPTPSYQQMSLLPVVEKDSVPF